MRLTWCASGELAGVRKPGRSGATVTMKQIYRIDNGALATCSEEHAEVVVFAAPSEVERQELISKYGVDQHSVESALDPEESPRVEFEDQGLSIIWKCPSNASVAEQLRFGVHSAGVFRRGKRVVIVLSDGRATLSGKEFQKLGSCNELILRYLLATVHHYIGHLRVIKMITTDIQEKLNRSLENQYFIQMFVLSESLIYYLDALEGNMAVLLKVQKTSEKAGWSRAELDLLDDVLIEQQQCVRQAQIYSSVLSGLMDARGNIINNNMNVLLKKLTLINVTFLPLNLIAGVFGMSEFSAMTPGLPMWFTYGVFMFMLGVTGWITWVLIVRFLEKSEQGGRNKKWFARK